MEPADVAQLIAAGATSVAAVAAAASAFLSRAAIERANLAFVWPDFRVTDDETSGLPYAVVRLRSDGPGVALDVRWSILYVPEPGRKHWRRAEEEAAASATRAVRALRPGESFPPEGKHVEGRAVDPALRDEPWWIVVRWSDSAGRRWEFREDSAGGLLGRARRVRRPRW